MSDKIMFQVSKEEYFLLCSIHAQSMALLDGCEYPKETLPKLSKELEDLRINNRKEIDELLKQ